MDLYLPEKSRPRWASFENPNASAGGAAMTNAGLKGAASAPLAGGARVTLLPAVGQRIAHLDVALP